MARSTASLRSSSMSHLPWHSTVLSAKFKAVRAPWHPSKILIRGATPWTPRNSPARRAPASGGPRLASESPRAPAKPAPTTTGGTRLRRAAARARHLSASVRLGGALLRHGRPRAGLAAPRAAGTAPGGGGPRAGRGGGGRRLLRGRDRLREECGDAGRP